MVGQIGNNLFSNSMFSNPTFRGLGNKYGLSKQAEETSEDETTATTAAQKEKDAAATVAATAAEDEDSAVAATGDTEDTTTSSVTSFLDDFKKQLNDALMSSLGLNNLSDLQNGSGLGNLNELFGSAMSGNSFSAMQISAQFEINFQSVMAVAGENGMQMQSTSFSLKASFEFMGMSSGSGTGFNPFATTESEETDPMAAMRDLFSPEKTAQRILDFALSFFPNSKQYAEGGNTESSRQSFSDIMSAAVQKGFDQALGLLGKLPKETEEEIDQTHEKVFSGFEDFVKNGYDWQNSNYSSIQSYTSSFEMNYSSTSIYYSEDEMNSLYGNNYPAVSAASTETTDTSAAAESYAAAAAQTETPAEETVAEENTETVSVTA